MCLHLRFVRMSTTGEKVLVAPAPLWHPLTTAGGVLGYFSSCAVLFMLCHVWHGHPVLPECFSPFSHDSIEIITRLIRLRGLPPMRSASLTDAVRLPVGAAGGWWQPSAPPSHPLPTQKCKDTGGPCLPGFIERVRVPAHRGRQRWGASRTPESRQTLQAPRQLPGDEAGLSGSPDGCEHTVRASPHCRAPR